MKQFDPAVLLALYTWALQVGPEALAAFNTLMNIFHKPTLIGAAPTEHSDEVKKAVEVLTNHLNANCSHCH